MTKRLVLVMVAVMGLSGAVHAGVEDSTPAQRAALQTEFMKAKLGLDEGTLKKVDAVNRRYADLVEPVLKGTDGMFQKRSKVQALMEAKDKELRTLFSESQFKQYDDSKDELKAYLDSRL